jgi:hypothetical protein
MNSKIIAVPIGILLAVSTLAAQSTHSQWHNIKGIVVDRMGHPVANATVCLKDVAGHSLRMKQTERNGTFSFGLVNLRVDREIYAEQGGLISLKMPLLGSVPQRNIVVKLKVSDTQPHIAKKS